MYLKGWSGDVAGGERDGDMQRLIDGNRVMSLDEAIAEIWLCSAEAGT